VKLTGRDWEGRGRKPESGENLKPEGVEGEGRGVDRGGLGGEVGKDERLENLKPEGGRFRGLEV
jgi:hypothetical protein